MIKKSLLMGVLICTLLAGCSGRKPRDPNQTYLDEIKHVKTKDISHVGLFTTKPVSNFYIDKTESPYALFLNLPKLNVSQVKFPKKIKDPAIKSIEVKEVPSPEGKTSQLWIYLNQDVDFTTRQTEYGLRVDFRPLGNPLPTVAEQAPPKALSTPDEEAEKERSDDEEKELQEQEETESETGAPTIGDAAPTPPLEPIEPSENKSSQNVTDDVEEDSEDLAPPSESTPEVLPPSKTEPQALPPSPEDEDEEEIEVEPPKDKRPSSEGAPSQKEEPALTQKLLQSLNRETTSLKEQLTLVASQAFDLQKEEEDRRLILEIKDFKPSSAVVPQEFEELDSFLQKIDVIVQESPYPSTKIIFEFSESIAVKLSHTANELSIEFKKRPVATYLESQKKAPLDYGHYLTSPTQLPGRKISIQAKDTDLSEVFKMISNASDYNIIVGKDVAGKLTLRLVNVPWDQAFVAILQAYRLGYTQQGNILRISTLEALKSEKEIAYQALEAKETLETLDVLFLPIAYRKAALMSRHLYPLLSGRGSISIDRPTNTIIIRDTKERLAQVKNFVASLDKK
ncbi:MAG: secretin and TonB N-terminal domain-containing protein [Deltaproteobacteria bacterium]|nr:secretin and TonB N-terminal domain-containing protein [Deltaproteobacteria bacterium]